MSSTVAIWDTYVKRRDGSVCHFDIIVPAALQDAEAIYRYGKQYLESIQEPEGVIESEVCQFCHLESPTQEMLTAIERDGYFILVMEDIPAELPAEPTRRDLILHLRAHHAQYRFADFKGKSIEDIQVLFHS